VIHLVWRRTPRGSERHWNIIGALVFGAAMAAVTKELARPALPAPQLVGLAVVLAVAVLITRREDRAAAAAGPPGA
jgi:hypothetical protein